MKFELVVPPVDNLTTDEVVNAFIQTVQSKKSSDAPVIAEKYVTFDGKPDFPQAIDCGAVAGELRDLPKKKADGKWYVDIDLLDTDSGKRLRLIMPYLKQAGNPIVALMDGVVDMAIPDKVFNLHIKFGQVPPHLK